MAIAKGNLENSRARRQPSGAGKATVRSAQPGLISIPLGFLAVILGSLLYRDKRAEDMWDELYVRQTPASSLPRPQHISAT